MGYIIEISENKVEKMADYAEKMLRYGGKLMSCIDEINEERGFHERRNYGHRDGSSSYGSRYGMRHEDYGRDDDSEWEEMRERDYMGERRHRDSRGRYTRG